MKYIETLTKKVQISDTLMVRYYSFNSPQLREQRNLNDLFGLQEQTIRVEKTGGNNVE